MRQLCRSINQGRSDLVDVIPVPGVDDRESAFYLPLAVEYGRGYRPHPWEDFAVTDRPAAVAGGYELGSVVSVGRVGL